MVVRYAIAADFATPGTVGAALPWIADLPQEVQDRVGNQVGLVPMHVMAAI